MIERVSGEEPWKEYRKPGDLKRAMDDKVSFLDQSWSRTAVRFRFYVEKISGRSVSFLEIKTLHQNIEH